jgi:hypothetical protein
MQDIPQGERETIFRKFADAVYAAGLLISPSHRLSVPWGKWRASQVPDSMGDNIREARLKRSENNAAEVYSIVITGILAAMLIAMPRGISWMGLLALALAVLRWFEIQTFGLGILLNDEEMSGAYIVSVGVAAVGLGLISAIATVVLANGAHDWNWQTPHNFGDVLYSSFSNMIVLGNSDYVPQSESAKLIVVFTGISGVILLTAYLSRVISRLLPAADCCPADRERAPL